MNDLDWTVADNKLKQLISLYIKSGCFPENYFAKDLYPLREQFEHGVRSEGLFAKIMNFRPWLGTLGEQVTEWSKINQIAISVPNSYINAPF